jgi:hypothetical protein
MAKLYALSIKQPWAALLVCGRKTIEVRNWPTARRGRILIHAARICDERPEAWTHVSAELEPLARQNGGILGVAELASCCRYESREAFTLDCKQHLNLPDWFAPPVLYGFTFEAARVLPFHHYPGWMRFFPVEWDEATGTAALPTHERT